MKRYVLSRAAITDLREIWNYTTNTWDERQAERYVQSIHDACATLADGRKKGRSVLGAPGYLKLAVGAHFIFYRTEDSAPIKVIRILHQRMDVKTRLTE